jgi:hypothetical protein
MSDTAEGTTVTDVRMGGTTVIVDVATTVVVPFVAVAVITAVPAARPNTRPGVSASTVAIDTSLEDQETGLKIQAPF